MSASSQILIIAGEKSGEKHGAALVEAYKKFDPEARFFGVGGSHMEKAGVRLIGRIEDLAVMGIFEIVSQLPRIKRIFERVKSEVRNDHPRAAVLIDSPDFNLRMARYLKKQDIPILYYISPTVWAWRKSRLKTIRRTVSRMLLIFPFEKTLYDDFHIPAAYVGHPLLENFPSPPEREGVFHRFKLDPGQALVALLPGSRDIEIRHHLPTLMKAVRQIAARSKAQFVLLRADNLDQRKLAQYIPEDLKNVICVTDTGYHDLLAVSDVALSACGTANLEAALLETPMVAFYRVSPLTYCLGKPFVKIQRYSIVNILAGKDIIPELIQKDFSAEKLAQETLQLLGSRDRQQSMIQQFRSIREVLGDRPASQESARELASLLSVTQPHLNV